MIKSRTLSETGCELFSVASPFSPKKKMSFTKMNSWVDTSSDSEKTSPRRKSTGCIDIKKFNLKNIYLNLITTDFDKKLEININNMRNASKKLLECLYTKEKTIPYYTDNAVSNLIILILSNGEKYLTKQNVKHNIHFYLKLAEKAMQNNDHQTAILIKITLENHNIKRLNIEYNKREKKIVTDLNYRYGTFKDCHGKHIREFLDNAKQNEPIIDKEYLPSAMVLHMHTAKNKAYTKAFTRMGKYPKNLLEITDKMDNLKKLYHTAFFGNKYSLLTKLYDTDPKSLKISKELLEWQCDKDNISQLLFKLSCNVKKCDSNKSEKLDKEIHRWNRVKFCK